MWPNLRQSTVMAEAWVMGCSLFFRHVSKFLMVALAHKSPCVDCGNGQKNEQPSSPCSGHHKCYSTKVIILRSHGDFSSARGKSTERGPQNVFCILYLHNKQTKIGEEQIDMHKYLFVLQWPGWACAGTTRGNVSFWPLKVTHVHIYSLHQCQIWFIRYNYYK